jgi:hypothetical protein
LNYWSAFAIYGAGRDFIMQRVVSIATVMALLCGAAAVRAQEVCVGDCNDSGDVTINELILGVNLASDPARLSECPSFACQGGDMVPINCLIKAVNNASNGCPGTNPTQERVYAIDCGELLTDQNVSPSGIFSSGLSDANASTGFPPGPLTLVLGTPGSDGVASFTLKNDVTLDIGLVDGSRFCLKFDASLSTGSIDCNGGTPYDITATRPSNAPGVDYTFMTGLGDPAPAGNGNLILTGLFKVVPATDPTTPCDSIAYTDPPQEFAFTTTNGTATVTGTTLSLTVPGQAFNCDTFSTPNSGGRLAAPLPAGQAVSPIGNVVNSLRFGERVPGSCTAGLQ